MRIYDIFIFALREYEYMNFLFALLNIAVVKAYGRTSDGHINRWDSHF
jgi:hypothetical protein